MASNVSIAERVAREREIVKTSEIKRKKIRTRHEWVLIRKIDPKDKLTDGGLVITEGQARSSLGEIISCSEKVTDLRRGDIVIFTNFPIELEDLEDATGDKSLRLVRDEEVYAVLEDED